MSRLEFSTQTKRQARDRANGKCECWLVPQLHRRKGDCGHTVGDANIFYEHITQAFMRDDASLENCAVLSKSCWKEKTKLDLAAVADAKRQEDRRSNIKARKGRPLAGTKASGWKQRMDGTWERRP